MPPKARIILCAALLLIAESSAEDSGPRRRPVSFGLYAVGDYRYPVGDLAESWHPYPTAGFAVLVPGVRDALFLRGQASGGVLKPKKTFLPQVKIVHMALYAERHFTLKPDKILLAPQAGLTNMTIFLDKPQTKNVFAPFATSENEFGAMAGVAFILRRGYCELATPVQISAALSSPSPFITASAGITIGLRR